MNDYIFKVSYDADQHWKLYTYIEQAAPTAEAAKKIVESKYPAIELIWVAQKTHNIVKGKLK